MTNSEIFVWLLDLALLARILWQGELLVRMDKERLDLERAKHARETERWEEQKAWRTAKQRLKLKGLETAANVSGLTTDGPTTCTTPFLPPKTDDVPPVVENPSISH
jgi:hypothetical protein